MAHLQRREDVLLQEVGEGVARARFDDQRQQGIGGIAVAVLCPGRQAGLVLLQEQAQHIAVHHGNLRAFRNEVFVIEQARGVVQQMAKSDLAAVVGEFREEIGQALVERKLLALGQDQHRHGGELLGDRREAEVGVCAARDLLLQVGEAIGFGQGDLAAVEDHHAGAGAAGPIEVLEQTVEPGCQRVSLGRGSLGG